MRLSLARSTPVTLIALSLSCSGFAAPAPRTIAFTGLLTDPRGVPLNGPEQVRLALYTSVSDKTPVWTETKGVVATRGIFSTALGDKFPFPASLDFGQALFVGVTVGSDSKAPELTPRLALQGVPYALFAQTVADGAVTNTKLGNDAASLGKVSGGALNVVGGNVGIGTTTPSAPLEAQGGAGPTSLQVFPGNLYGVATPNAVTLDIPGGDGVMGVSDNLAVTGNVGIGTASPGAKLDVRGDIRLGSAGQYFAPSGDQNLLVQYGTINADGTAAPGSSMWALEVDKGRYSVWFPGYGSGQPIAMVATPFALAAGPPNSDPASVDIRASTMMWSMYTDGTWYVNYQVILTSNGERIEAPFTVMIVRPR